MSHKSGGANRSHHSSPISAATATATANVIWDPKQMKDQLPDEAARKELFVEMCFFARLGYVQPPCCLHCLYQEAQEAMENTSHNHHCERWVVFRKDTTIPLHPDYLEENIAFVRCCTVRKLLATDNDNPVVEGFVFDAQQCRFRKAKM